MPQTKKILFGLKQSPRLRNKNLFKTLKSFGFAHQNVVSATSNFIEDRVIVFFIIFVHDFGDYYCRDQGFPIVKV